MIAPLLEATLLHTCSGGFSQSTLVRLTSCH